MSSNKDIEFDKELESKSIKLPDQAGRNVMVLKDKQAFDLAGISGKSVHEIYTSALEKGIIPYRYIRNRDSISTQDQFALFTSHVSVIGAGGLGGQVILNLSRIGIGHLVVVDHDVFDETNLNRQALSSDNVLGQSKARTAVSIINSINPGIDVKAHHVKLHSSNSKSILQGSDIIVDALDNVSDRFVLEDMAREMDIPLVHGAVAGFEGQVMTIFPGDMGLESLYGKGRGTDPFHVNPVSILGVPSITPAIIATLQTMEVIKILLKREPTLRNKLAYLDLESLELKKFSFKK